MTSVRSLKLLLGMSVFVIIVGFGFGQPILAEDFSKSISQADNKVILEQFDEAKKIYKKVIDKSNVPSFVAYAHYKLGALYQKKQKTARAHQEYQKGLDTLFKAGHKNHKIGKYLTQAMKDMGR